MASTLSFPRVLTLVVGVAALVACGSSTTDNGSSSSSSGASGSSSGASSGASGSSSGSSGTPGVIEVKVSNFKYEPKDVTIKVGDKVKWVWAGGTHSVTEGSECAKKSGGFDSGTKSGEFSFEQTFTTAGKFDYFCDYMAHCTSFKQVGSVTVQ